MTLVVLGDAPIAWLTAAIAARESQEPVAVVAPDSATRRVDVHVQDGTGTREVTILTSGVFGRLDPDLVLVVATRIEETRSLVRAYRDDISRRIVFLAPGGAGGAAEVGASFDQWTIPRPILAETTGFPVLGNVVGDVVEITAVKRRLPVAVVDAQAASNVLDAIRRYLPWIESVDGILDTSLASTNNIIHPPLALLNAARIEAGEPFRFYGDGLTEAGVSLIEAIDRERLQLTDRLGLTRVPIVEWLRRFYGDQGMVGATLSAMLGSFEPFADSPGPTVLRHRYLIDDVRDGLAVIEAIGDQLDIELPVTRSVVTLASRLVQEDLRDRAPALAELLLMHAGALAASGDVRH